MTDAAILLRRILETPEDDTLRLVYADCIQDDDPERAKLIRTQIELEAVDYPLDDDNWDKVLWAQDACRGLAPGEIGTAPFFKARFTSLRTVEVEYESDTGGRNPIVTVDRGFLSELDVPAEFFSDPARVEGVFRTHPIVHINLYDAVKNTNGRRYVARTVVGGDVFSRMKTDVRVQTATPTVVWGDWRTLHRAVSAACLAWGRELAGLTAVSE